MPTNLTVLSDPKTRATNVTALSDPKTRARMLLLYPILQHGHECYRFIRP